MSRSPVGVLPYGRCRPVVRGSASAEPGSSDDAGYTRALSTGGIGSAPTTGAGACSRTRGPRPQDRSREAGPSGLPLPESRALSSPKGQGPRLTGTVRARAQDASRCQAIPLPRYAGRAAATGGCASWPTGLVRRDWCVSRTRRVANSPCGSRQVPSHLISRPAAPLASGRLHEVMAGEFGQAAMAKRRTAATPAMSPTTTASLSERCHPSKKKEGSRPPFPNPRRLQTPWDSSRSLSSDSRGPRCPFRHPSCSQLGLRHPPWTDPPAV